MKTLEMEKKTGGIRQLFGKKFALGITLMIDELHPVEFEFRGVKQALVNWDKTRGKNCQDVRLTFVARQPLHDAVEKYARLACTQDTFMGPFLKRCDTRLTLVDPNGQVCREITLS